MIESQEAASHQIPDGPSGPPALAAALESHHHSNGPSFGVSGTRLPILLRVPFIQRAQQPRQTDYPQTRNSKSTDLVADESNMRSLAEQRPAASSRGSDLGPTLVLWKSCSLESLQSAMSEARQLSQVPYHRPRPHTVRQSFRATIDKSYDGPSEPEDGDLSEQGSGRDTPVSGSSRQDQIESGAGKKKTKGKKKKEKKSKEKVKKTANSEDQEKAKKKGFGLLSERDQKLRRELQQARAAPAYEELGVSRRRALDYDPPRMAVRGPDTRPGPCYEDKERQYAAHSRSADPNDYPTQSRTAPGYSGRGNYYPPKEAQPRPSSQPPGPLQVDPRYYPSSPQRADQHQDVPPPPGTRAPRYETVGRDGYRDASPERYGGGYRDGRQPDPGQKNSMIGVV
ncbi:partitioning defective 3 homolog B-like [Oncorhynchus tshawytscha]|uniref:partitioning defective 3 homolog B-like n=1 Tax=Oncorhynchus tshawytscha TaxID=74940 RepID=UPI001C3D86FF|nr:partitioning defective 3 homolog B-like [Oncorhynchus tshawytscha]